MLYSIVFGVQKDEMWIIALQIMKNDSDFFSKAQRF